MAAFNKEMHTDKKYRIDFICNGSEPTKVRKTYPLPKGLTKANLVTGYKLITVTHGFVEFMVKDSLSLALREWLKTRVFQRRPMLQPLTIYHTWEYLAHIKENPKQILKHTHSLPDMWNGLIGKIMMNTVDMTMCV